MTYEEAKEMLDAAIEIARDEMAVALLMAYKAVEKQIPRKIIIDDGYDYCPTCGYNYGSDATRRMLYKWRQPFCKECGQALDWRNEK